MQKINEKIIRLASEKKYLSEESFSALKRQTIAGTKVKAVPGNVALLRIYKRMLRLGRIKKDRKLDHFLKKRKVRTLSGIASISVILHPFECPGKCIFCPTETGLPKSYLKDEPAVMRALANNFDPYKQVASRLQALQNAGHNTGKIELIVIGGTWSYYPEKYRLWYLKRCFEAANGIKTKSAAFSPEKLPAKKDAVLKKELVAQQKKNENAANRIIGITLETRPDHITEDEIKKMRFYGATRVELGVQNINNKILEKNIRGHRTKAVVAATKLLKDSAFKVSYHIMPGLWGSSMRSDILMFKKLFTDQRFRPDYLKIYPCVVLKNSPLYTVWKQKKYVPYSDKQLIKLLSAMKKTVPYYARIIRVIRDIPSSQIIAGGKTSNLREMVKKNMERLGWSCKCIRCREIQGGQKIAAKTRSFRQDYKASDGKEIFLSIEDPDRKNIYSFLRLRIPDKQKDKRSRFIKELHEAALIREVHTYGPSLPLGESGEGAQQHKGMGKELIGMAEKIAKDEFGAKKIAVISGIGVRGYYKKLGYKLSGTYMIKGLG